MSKLDLTPKSAALLVVDWQERLARAMPAEAEQRGRKNVGILLEAARQLGVPAVVSEQYPKGLGATVPDVDEAARSAAAERVEKLEFACTGNADFHRVAETLGRRAWIVCGMETHVCVYQTVRGLVESGATVHVVADAVCSRSDDNRRIGLDLCRAAGAVVSSTETVVFDLLQRAGTEEFKALSKLLR